MNVGKTMCLALVVALPALCAACGGNPAGPSDADQAAKACNSTTSTSLPSGFTVSGPAPDIKGVCGSPVLVQPKP
jgi:hypothetical protein